MAQHTAHIEWERESDDFSYQGYTRDHTWQFDNGLTVEASAAPGYLGNKDFIDPEEAFVASVASCHMLTFLAIASKRGLVIDRYIDDAVGVLEKNADGAMAITRIELRPVIEFAGGAPDAATLDEMHHKAHRHCFIANSVRTLVEVRQASSVADQ
ncbi:MAG: OsmC family protein [Phycisphaerales bacterium JB039]